MQLMSPTFDDLCRTYENLRAKDLRPHRSTNHGPMTSFYYRDPDGNNVELAAQNFPTFEAMSAFMASAAFRSNPPGQEIDSEEFVARYRRGEKIEDLTRLPA